MKGAKIRESVQIPGNTNGRRARLARRVRGHYLHAVILLETMFIQAIGVFRPTDRVPANDARRGRFRLRARVAPTGRQRPSCPSSHWRTSGVTGSVMSANSSCFLRNFAT
ncbi:hypothetical protein GCM10010222_48860 [Streptomyces tanashiensis]|nr:hypothetical protein GCM10010222_48860 [Streptomyces tanashiensis]